MTSAFPSTLPRQPHQSDSRIPKENHLWWQRLSAAAEWSSVSMAAVSSNHCPALACPMLALAIRMTMMTGPCRATPMMSACNRRQTKTIQTKTIPVYRHPTWRQSIQWQWTPAPRPRALKTTEAWPSPPRPRTHQAQGHAASALAAAAAARHSVTEPDWRKWPSWDSWSAVDQTSPCPLMLETHLLIDKLTVKFLQIDSLHLFC